MRNEKQGRKKNFLPLLLALACLAGAALLGIQALRIVRERQAGADSHALESSYVQEGLVTEDPAWTAAPAEPSEAPEAEALPDIAPEVIREVEEAALAEATSTPVPVTPTPSPEAASPTPSATPSAAPVPTPTPTPRMGRVVESSIHYTVDFAQLEEINPDVRGWLVQDGTDINYPIVQSTDNTYYLTHLFTGAENKTGTVFMDSGSSKYYTDMCTWLYAHNRKDGTMFASLPEYLSQNYYAAHPTLYLLTPYEDYQVDIFACVRTSKDVEAEWRVRSFSGRDAFDTYIDRVKAQSAIQTEVDVSWGDQLLVLCTCTNEVHEDRYVVYGRMRPIAYSDEEGQAVTTLELAAKGSLSKTVTIPGRGEVQYYAQNDPTWYSLRYEARTSTLHRPFGQGGCGPTAVAMALVNTATEEQLYRLLFAGKTEKGFSLCTCSVNQYFCNKRHVQLRIRDTAMLRAYLPVVMASFATGNNAWGVQSRTDDGGTGSSFMEYVCKACQVGYRNTRDAEEAIAAVENGAAAVFATGGTASPFTGNGHYLTLIHADEKYLYILDPFWKTDYSATDTRHVLDVLQPGVLRAKREDLRYLLMYSFYIFTPAETN